MQRQARDFVRALLPLVPMAICSGCGGGGSGGSAPMSQSAAPQAPVAPASVNRAPTISAAATELARVGVTYDYQPTAADADGDALRFSATNLPPWASMDPTNGHISGTPGESDLGVYESITIKVADSARETESSPFSITVVGEDAGNGIASLQWEKPPSKVDGSPLDDLAGYRILYGRNTNDLDRSVLIDDPATTSYEFSALDSGTWYFAVVAVNAGGLEGPATTVATKSI
ncbi:MAG: putative Ig domain-containing protein [Pseudomonadota bacterium]